MSLKSTQRMLRILELRKKKAEDEIARISTGIAAGRSLRSKIEAAESPGSFRELTIGYVTRTVGIIDRGLTVLSEQKAVATSVRQSLDARESLLRERAVEIAETNEALAMEDDIDEWMSRRHR